jgi:hypothetical protein
VNWSALPPEARRITRDASRRRGCARLANIPDVPTRGLADDAASNDGPAILIKERRYTFVECRVQSTIVNGPDGRPTQLTFGDEVYIDFEQGLRDPPAE